MAKFNEGKSLDAIVRVLEQVRGAPRKVLTRDTPSTRGIKLVCEIGGQRYAMEHTLIEPFPNNQKDNIEFATVFDEPFESEVRDLLKPHLAYTVTVDVYAFAGKSRKELARIRHDLLTWIRKSIPNLPEPKTFPETRIHSQHPDTPLKVTLASHRAAAGGRFTAQRFAPPTLEQLRDQRLLKALDDKGPKLKIARSPGTTTVLVLENPDQQLSNEGAISEAIERLGQNLAYMPDDIYLVGTYIADRFYVTQVRRDGRACVLMGDRDEPWEFASDALTDI
jgi:hypothetical protein